MASRTFESAAPSHVQIVANEQTELAIASKNRSKKSRNVLPEWVTSRQEFIGWSGLKRMLATNVNGQSDFVDIGYRYQQRHWGRGYATEAALGCLHYGFEQLALPEICAIAKLENAASRRVLQKIGLSEGNEFDWDGERCVWFSANREGWLKRF